MGKGGSVGGGNMFIKILESLRAVTIQSQTLAETLGPVFRSARNLTILCTALVMSHFRKDRVQDEWQSHTLLYMVY